MDGQIMKSEGLVRACRLNAGRYDTQKNIYETIHVGLKHLSKLKNVKVQPHNRLMYDIQSD